ncbi:MAG: CAP domain-containing protein [Actinobacteria bacterium]|nr:CAP domain-containing protein [Actinomycetota bacterium]
MARTRMLIVLVAVALATAGVGVASAADHADRYMMRTVNEVRAQSGLQRLHVSHDLNHSAAQYARYLMRHQYFGHDSYIHASSRWRRLGEILEIQTGLKPHVRRAFDTWMGSSEHRSIILDPGFTSMGAGRASGWFQGRKMVIWVMHFGHH